MHSPGCSQQDELEQLMAQEQQLLRQEKERLQREARSSATELVHAREKVGDGSDCL